MSAEVIVTQRVATPAGDIILASYCEQLCLSDWVINRHRERIDKHLQRFLRTTMVEGETPVISQARSQLEEYFAGKRRKFTIPLLLVGTPWQQNVWHEIYTLPYATTITYARLAARLGMPDGVRATANAVGANTHSIFIPCHRVLGAGNTLTGYAGGIDAKRVLLDLEGVNYSLK